MKKLYVFVLVGISAYCLGQQTIKIKESQKQSFTNPKNGVVKPLDLTGTSLTCETGYVAGTTMDLNFTLHVETDSDFEYGDSLAITFPIGITPVSSPQDSFPSNNYLGGAEYIHPITGQTVSWGINNDDQYGGISAGDLNFQIKVTIGGSITGNQTGNFLLSGDGFGSMPMDASGTFIIKPKHAIDIYMLGAYIPSGCGLSNESVFCGFVNNGSNAISGFPLNYSNNGNTPVSETYTVTVNPGDTAYYAFTTLLDMSAAGNYNLKVYSTATGDGDVTNDTTTYLAEILAPIAITTTAVTNSFDVTTDLIGWSAIDVDASGFSWDRWASAPDAHSGAALMNAWEDDVDGMSDDWLFSRCMDFTSGKLYQLTYWKKLTAAYKGSLEVKLGSDQSISAMTQSLVALTSVTPNGTYSKDSVTFSVSATGTYYLGFRAVNFDVNATIDFYLDDVKLKEIGNVGINEINADEISIYPNPSNGLFNVTIPKNATQLEVYNIVGERIYSLGNMNTGLNTLNLSGVAPGSYIVKLISNNNVFVKNIIIQ